MNMYLQQVVKYEPLVRITYCIEHFLRRKTNNAFSNKAEEEAEMSGKGQWLVCTCRMVTLEFFVSALPRPSLCHQTCERETVIIMNTKQKSASPPIIALIFVSIWIVKLQSTNMKQLNTTLTELQ